MHIYSLYSSSSQIYKPNVLKKLIRARILRNIFHIILNNFIHTLFIYGSIKFSFIIQNKIYTIREEMVGAKLLSTVLPMLKTPVWHNLDYSCSILSKFVAIERESAPFSQSFSILDVIWHVSRKKSRSFKAPTHSPIKRVGDPARAHMHACVHRAGTNETALSPRIRWTFLIATEFALTKQKDRNQIRRRYARGHSRRVRVRGFVREREREFPCAKRAWDLTNIPDPWCVANDWVNSWYNPLDYPEGRNANAEGFFMLLTLCRG